MTHQNAPKHTPNVNLKKLPRRNCRVNPSKLQKGVFNKFATKKKHAVQRNKKDQTVIQQPPKKVSWIAACDGISRAQYLLEVYLDSHPS